MCYETLRSLLGMLCKMFHTPPQKGFFACFHVPDKIRRRKNQTKCCRVIIENGLKILLGSISGMLVVMRNTPKPWCCHHKDSSLLLLPPGADSGFPLRLLLIENGCNRGQTYSTLRCRKWTNLLKRYHLSEPTFFALSELTDFKKLFYFILIWTKQDAKI